MKHLSSLDGFRAISHIFIIFAHVTGFTKLHLPSEGEVWNALGTSFLFKFLGLGYFAVDWFFLISGFLLSYHMCNYGLAQYKGVLSFVLQRWMRMFPTIAFIGIICSIFIGDDWELMPLGSKIVSTFLYLIFCNNYSPGYESYSLLVTWSCCVDMHAGIAIFIVFSMFSLSFKKYDAAEKFNALSKLKWIFVLMAALGIFIRLFLFDQEFSNEATVSKYSHNGYILNSFKLSWIENYYKRKSYIFHVFGNQYS